MKKILFMGLVLAISGSIMGGLFAISGTTSITIATSGVATNGGGVDRQRADAHAGAGGRHERRDHDLL